MNELFIPHSEREFEHFPLKKDFSIVCLIKTVQVREIAVSDWDGSQVGFFILYLIFTYLFGCIWF